VARALGALPLLAEAMARAELSYAKVRALTRVATAETEARLLGVGRSGTAAHVEQIVRSWRKVDRQAEAREARRRHASRALHLRQDDDGMVIVRGRLEPEVGALFRQALAAARELLYQRARAKAAATDSTAETCVPSASRCPDARQSPDASSSADISVGVSHAGAGAHGETSASAEAGRGTPSAWRPRSSENAPSPSSWAAPSSGDAPLSADAHSSTVSSFGSCSSADSRSDALDDRPTLAQQQADALALLLEAALHHDLDPGAPGERYQVVVHVDAPALADPDQPGQSVLEDGGHVPAETSRRLACDASRVVMRHDEEGRVVEIGARTRTIPPAIRRALQHRDRGCRFPGCASRITQGHHLHHWAQGGPTTLSNLALLCRRHHRSVHEEGYQVAREPDGTLRFRRPDGRLLPESPPPATVPGDPVGALRARHVADGFRINARTGCPSWLGERLDLAWAIDVLHPLAARPRPRPAPDCCSERSE